MRRGFLPFLLLALALALSACDKQQGDAVIALPNVTATLERTFTYSETAEQSKAVYTLTAHELQLSSESDRMEVGFAPTRPAANDVLIFELLHADLLSGYVGKYTLGYFQPPEVTQPPLTPPSTLAA